MTKLNVKAFTIACSLTWAISVLFLGWASALGWGYGFVATLSTYYVGYAPTLLGDIIGALWALVDGAVGGWIFVLLYNAFAEK